LNETINYSLPNLIDLDFQTPKIKSVTIPGFQTLLSFNISTNTITFNAKDSKHLGDHLVIVIVTDGIDYP
jgi:hypothetical protein